MLGVKDLDLKILLNLDDRSLLNACQTSSRYAELCGSEDFWRTRYIQQFGVEAARHKPQNVTWKKDYLQTVIDLENFPGLDKLSLLIAWDTQNGLDQSYWTIRNTIGFPTVKEVKPFTEAPNKVMSWFWLKRLDKIKLKTPDGVKTLYNVTPKDLYMIASKNSREQYLTRFTYNVVSDLWNPVYMSKNNLLG